MCSTVFKLQGLHISSYRGVMKFNLALALKMPILVHLASSLSLKIQVLSTLAEETGLHRYFGPM